MPFFSIAPGCLLVEAASAAAFPATGAANTIYIAQDTNALYRWSGSAYVMVSASPEEVIEAANLAAFPATGEAGKLYVAVDTGKAYRWTGSVYVEVSAAPASTDALAEGATNLYHTFARAAAAAPVQSVAGKTGAVTLAKGDVGLGNVDNTSDANKPISTATQTALDGKAASSHSHAAGDVTSGTFDVARIPTGSTSTTVCIGNDSRLSNARTPTAHVHAAGDITSGTVAAARLGSGTADSTTFLRGDGTWAAAGSTNASDLTSGTLAAARIGAHASSHQTGQADAINPVIVTPSSLSASQNDYAPGVCDILRLSSSTAIDLTGLVAGTVDGAMRLVINTNASGGAAITLKHESTSSAAANRFRNSAGGDYVIAADGGSALLTYSTAISRWRIL